MKEKNNEKNIKKLNVKEMDKKQKIIFVGVIIIAIIILALLIDFFSIGVRNKPVFAISGNISEGNITYKGLFYNTYYCFDEDDAFIKGKGSKFACPTEIDENLVYGKITSVSDVTFVIEITEETQNIKVGDTVVVKIEDKLNLIGSNRLFEDQIIKVRPDLIAETYPIQISTSNIGIISNSVEVNVEYSKTRELEEKVTIDNDDENYKVYYLGVEKLNVQIYDDTYELTDVLLNNITSFNKMITKLSYIGRFDEDTPYIIDNRARMYKTKDYTLIKCNYVDSETGYINQNLYVGDKNMEFEESYCQ